ncbi:hypothetical protein [Bradyrhizobium sp. CCBAU 53421]|uniref:hypothetical protein n=1 Tax=Bradyrhizobium sp. CCBAU 53421 TaxID=1325120 RepID=UPI00188D3B5E|nr:hypothetical protein [Bradyrhizobium sp. CCBAU 53421]QOZ32823.1 hypothetical protein XH92_14930 [Bradyrhizobium sp. CCBAU 53421]
MGDFQAYILGDHGHIKQRIDLSCADENAAKERVKSLLNRNSIELWQFDHLIATLHPDPIKTASAARWIKSWLRLPN